MLTGCARQRTQANLQVASLTLPNSTQAKLTHLPGLNSGELTSHQRELLRVFPTPFRSMSPQVYLLTFLCVSFHISCQVLLGGEVHDHRLPRVHQPLRAQRALEPLRHLGHGALGPLPGGAERGADRLRLHLERDLVQEGLGGQEPASGRQGLQDAAEELFKWLFQWPLRDL